MGAILEFLIALLLVFLLLSMIVSSLHEYWSSRIGKNDRSVLLYKSLLKIFNDRSNRNFTDDLYRHPLIENSKRDQDNLPAYLDATTFSGTLTDIFVRDANELKIEYDTSGKPKVIEPRVDPTQAFENFKSSVESLNTSDVKKLLQSFLHNANDMTSLRGQMETWYNNYQDRVSGWYKRWIQKQLFVIALLVTVFINADLFRITTALWHDKQLRDIMVQQAVAIAKDSTYVKEFQALDAEEKKKATDSIYNSLKLSGLPIGWISELPGKEAAKMKSQFPPEGQRTFSQTIKYKWTYFRKLVRLNVDKYLSFSTVLGWVLMAFALRMGAPFWFEALSKLINIRGAGGRPQSSQKSTAP